MVAVEPSSAMRAFAQARHADRPIQWIPDSLPALDRTFKSGLSFDVILLSAVWMHVAPSDRQRAFRKLVTLLKPGGVLALTLRSGPAEPERGFHPVSADEIRTLARNHGASVEREGSSDDFQGRREVRWTQVAVRLPDDGTGALPLLRHIILLDSKSSTYKLALLRTLCRIADGACGMARAEDDDHVSIPMGLVALTWIRLYKPLLEEDLPQNPRNRRGGTHLGFAKEAFQELASVSHHDPSRRHAFLACDGKRPSQGTPVRCRHHRQHAGTVHHLPQQQAPGSVLLRSWSRGETGFDGCQT